jgi:peroxiredoxin
MSVPPARPVDPAGSSPGPRARLGRGVRSGLGLLLSLFAALGCGGSGAKGSIGAPAAEFSLTALDGSAVRLRDYSGRIVVLDFWATWCRPCQLEIPHFIALESEYGPRGLAVIGVAVNDREDNVRVFAERMRINYPTALGSDGLVQAYGGFNAIPTTFIIAPDGKIAARYTGYQDKQVFTDVIEKLLPQVQPTD